MRLAIIALAATLTLSACSGDGSSLTPAPGVAAAITPVAGDQQTVTVGHPVAINPSVRVTDGLGDPVANVSVTFSVKLGGGSADGTDQTTDATGLATVAQWTAGTAAGSNTLSALSPGLEGSPVEFTATAVAGPAVALSKNAGDNQTASVRSAVGPVSVLVSDAYGNPVADIPVTFVVASGGGSVKGGQQVTGVNGIATVGSWTLGATLGQNTLTAAATGLSGPPLVFAATATPLPTAVTVNVANNFFRSLRNGSGDEGGLFGHAAVDTIAVGGTVTWEWVGRGHNVTPYGTAFTESGTHSLPFTFGPITFNARGEYTYRCTIHSRVERYLGLILMRGVIIVR